MKISPTSRIDKAIKASPKVIDKAKVKFDKVIDQFEQCLTAYVMDAKSATKHHADAVKKHATFKKHLSGQDAKKAEAVLKEIGAHVQSHHHFEGIFATHVRKMEELAKAKKPSGPGSRWFNAGPTTKGKELPRLQKDMHAAEIAYIKEKAELAKLSDDAKKTLEALKKNQARS